MESTPLEYVEHPVIDISFNDINLENYELINSFAPFGEAWPSPNFRLKHVRCDSLMYSKDGQHILTMVGKNLKLVGFNKPRSDLKDKTYINVIGALKKTYFRGQYTLEYRISDIEDFVS